ncbi:hypothetical protein I5M92_22115 [Serratia marcescens]|nr:hypothetical protein [Serratia marcescens]
MNNNINKDDAIKYLATEFQTDEQSRFKTIKPTKQLIKDIADAVTYIKQEEKYEEEKKKWGVISTLNSLAILTILTLIFSINRDSDSEYLGEWKLYTYLASVSFTTIWIEVNIEKSYFFNELWRFSITKIMVSLSITALIVFSTATASFQINNIFGVDSSYFPFTRSFLTAYLFFTYASKIIYVLLIAASLNLLLIVLYIKDILNGENEREFPWGSICFVILTLILTYFSWFWVSNNFNDKKLNEKIYLLAHQLDFNDSNLCENLRGEHVSVIFLGSEQRQVLVDFNTIKPDSVSSFVEGKHFFSIEMKNLKVIPCSYEKKTIN